jgi:hypothetical protein
MFVVERDKASHSKVGEPVPHRKGHEGVLEGIDKTFGKL